MKEKLLLESDEDASPDEEVFDVSILEDVEGLSSDDLDPEALIPPQDDRPPAHSFAQVRNSYANLAQVLRPPGRQPIAEIKSEKTEDGRSVVLYVLNEWFNSARPFIELKRVAIKRDGTFGAESPLRLEHMLQASPPKCVTELDQQIGKLWSAVGSYTSKLGLGQYSIDDEPDLFSLLLARILSTGRCHFQSKNTPALQPGNLLPGKVVWEEIQGHQRLAIAGTECGAEHLCIRWKYPWYLNREKFICGPVSIAMSPTDVEAILSASPVSRREAPAVQLLFSEMGLDQIIPPPKSNQKLQVRIVAPRHSLQIEVMQCLAPTFVGSSNLSPTGEELKVIGVTSDLPELAEGPVANDDGTVTIERYEARPLQLSALFEKMGFREIAASTFGTSAKQTRYFLPVSASSWADFDNTHKNELESLGWTIASGPSKRLELVQLDSRDLSVYVEYEDNWWFSLTLTLEFEGQKYSLFPMLKSAIRSLPQTEKIDAYVIEALNRNGKFYSVLPGGKIFCIPFEQIRTILIAVQEMIWKDKTASKFKVSVLDAEELFKSELMVNARLLGNDKLTALIDCLRELSSVPPAKPPGKFGTELRPYQLEGLSWLQVLARNNFGGILADDMGLGKTVQILAHICLEKQNKRQLTPFLVICPTSVLPNWLSESEKFCPHLNVVPFAGSRRFSSRLNLEQADLIISTYSLVIRDLEFFRSINWHGIGLDESQAIKNADSQVSRVIGSIPANHRFCITGTPIENNLGELWAQFRFLLPGLLGDQRSFRDDFRRPIEEFGDELKRKVLTRRIRPFTLRRTKSEVESELPEKTTIIQTVELTGDQRELYEIVRLASTKKIRSEINDKGIKQSQIWILDALLKLRQVCCDPRLVKLTAARQVENSSKLGVLLEKLVELVAEGRKVLVFSQFTSMLDLVAEELKKQNLAFEQLRGDTTDRVTPVARFQAGEVPIFLISLKAGGTGLNLTAADTVIHYDPWWNPAVEEQATDRAHRIGQTKNVFVYKLIAKGTIEQRMLELQARKRALANSILDETGPHNMALDEEDIEFLLAPIESV